MVDLTLHKKELLILKSLVDHKFIRVIYDAKIDPTIMGKLRLVINNKNYELYNNFEYVDYLNSKDEITKFSLLEIADGKEFETSFNDSFSKIVTINEKITNIKIIRDNIKVESCNYELTIDNAIIIETNLNSYIFSKSTWFSNIIKFGKNKLINDLYSLKDVYDDFYDPDLSKPIVKREVINL